MRSAQPPIVPRSTPRGFTLIELMIVIAILAVLAVGAVPLGELAVQRTREQDLRLGLRQIRTAIDAYKKAADEGRVERKADETGYPRRLADLVNGMPDIKTPDKKLIRFLRRLPRDPFTGGTDWGKRSVQDDPKSQSWGGQNVFDVFSKTMEKAPDGTLYSEW